MSPRRSLSLAGRLTVLSLLAFLGSLLVGGYASYVMYELYDQQKQDLRQARLSASLLEMDEIHESLQGAVYARYGGFGGSSPGAGVDAGPRNGALELQLLALDLADGDHGEDLRRLGTEEAAFSQRAVALLNASKLTRAQVEAFGTESARLTERLHARHEALTAESDAASVRRQAQVVKDVVSLAVVAVGAGVLLFVAGWQIRRWLLNSLRHLATVARAVADGDLTARSAFTGSDEVAVLSQILDETSASLQKAFGELDADAGRQDFRARLDRALNQADDDGQVADTVARALAIIDPTRPAELLVADSSDAHLQALATTPGLDAPGCRVMTPWSCPSVRGGRTILHGTSETLDACPHLRGRPEGPRAAVCIPVSFMGRVTGVLHSATAPDSLPDTEELLRLEMVAEQAGARLGSMHALAQVQRQAALDGLTGLPNRRSFEDEVRRLRASHTRYGLLLLDLDRFKNINDTFGHATGDQALRQFADVLRSCLRDQDLACRFGGEEFAAVVPDGDASEAAAVAGRVRAALAQATATGNGPVFTVSVGVADSMMAGSLPEQLALADAALLAAKQAGRDRCLVARAGEDARQDDVSAALDVATR